MYGKKLGIERVVVDSLSDLAMRVPENKIRDELFQLFTTLTSHRVTSLVTVEKPTGSTKISPYGVEEFLAHKDLRLPAIVILIIGKTIYRNMAIIYLNLREI